MKEILLIISSGMIVVGLLMTAGIAWGMFSQNKNKKFLYEVDHE